MRGLNRLLGGLIVFSLAHGTAGAGVTIRDVVDRLLSRDMPATATLAGADFNLDGRVDVADLVARLNASRATFTGRVYNAVTHAPLAAFTVSLAGNATTRRAFSAGSFATELPIGGDGGRVQVILRIEAADHTWCERRVEAMAGERINAGDFFLVPTDPAQATIGPAGGQYRNSDGSLTITVPAGALASPATLRSAIFPTAESLPAPLPKSSHFTYCIDLLPDGAEFTTGVTVRFRNTRGFAAGTPIPIGVYDASLHAWRPEGMSQVTADGQWVEFRATHFTYYDANFPPPPERQPTDEDDDDEEDEDDDDEEDDEDCEENEEGSRVSTRYANLKQRIPLFSMVAGTAKKTFALEYDSRAAWPSALIGVTDRRTSAGTPGAPVAREVEVEVNGMRRRVRFDVRNGRSHFSHLLTCADDGGAWWPSGVYPGRLRLHQLFPVTFYTAAYFGGPPLASTQVDSGGANLERFTIEYPLNVGVLNLRDSPLGPGWAVGGVQRIYWDRLRPPLVTEGTRRQVFGGIGAIRPLAGTGEYATGRPANGSLATGVRLLRPYCVDGAPDGDIYFVMRDQNGISLIYRIDADGRLWLFAGDGTGWPTTGMPALEAKLTWTNDIAAAPGGILFLSCGDYVRWIDAAGILHSVPDSYKVTAGLDADDRGNVYLCSAGSVKRSAPPYEATVRIAGGGRTPAPQAHGLDPLQAKFEGINDIAADAEGNVYISDGTHRQIYRVSARTGLLEIVAGRYDPPEAAHRFTHMEGPAMQCELGRPAGLAVDGAGRVFFSDLAHHAIGCVDSDGNVQRVAGKGYPGDGGDGTSARAASLNTPLGIGFTPDGNLAIADTYNTRLRQIDLAGVVALGGVMPAPPGEMSKLVLLESGGWKRSWPDGRIIEFNPRGLPVREIDPFGLFTRYSHDAAGRLRQIDDDSGNLIAFEYDGATSRTRAIMGPGGRRWTLSRDARGNLTGIDGPGGEDWAFSYNGQDLMTGKTPPGLETTTYQYANTRVTAIDAPGTGSTILRAEGLKGLMNNLSEAIFADQSTALASDVNSTGSVTDARGETRLVRTNSRGLPVVTVDPLGNRTRTWWMRSCHAPLGLNLPLGNAYRGAYNIFGAIVSYTMPGGATTTYSYDDANRLTRADGTIDRNYVYDALGRIAETYIRAPSHHRYRFSYDDSRRLSEILDPACKTATFAYDAGGRMSRKITPGGRQYDYAHDGAGFLREVTGPAGTVISYERDAHGRATAIRDGGDRTTQLEYHSTGEPSQVALPDGRTATTTLDANGRLRTLAFAGSAPGPGMALAEAPAIYQFERDAAGNVTRVTDPNGRATRYEYDAAGRMTAMIDALEARHTLAWDANGDLTRHTDPTSRTVMIERNIDRGIQAIRTVDGVTSFTYLRPEKMASKKPTNGIVQTYTYGEVNALPYRRHYYEDGNKDATVSYNSLMRISSTNSSYGAYGYEYDGDGNITLVDTWPSIYYHHSERYTWACCGRPASIAGRAVFRYDSAGRLEIFADDLANTVTFSYAANRDVPARTDYGPNVYAEMTYDDRMRMASQQIVGPGGAALHSATYAYDAIGNCTGETINGVAYLYEYDPLYRLARVRRDGALVAEYTYDPAGNRLTGPAGQVCTYDTNGRLTAAGLVSYEYDAWGNVVRRSSPSGTRTFRYNGLGELAKSSDGTTTYTYNYDLFGRRAHRSWLSGTVQSRQYLYSPLSELECSAVWERWIVKHPLTGLPLELIVRNGGRYFIHHDAHLRPVLITSTGGEVVWRATYDPFGAATVDPSSSITYNHRLPGQVYDSETGLHYNHHRYYDPEIGRFLQVDPLLASNRLTAQTLLLTQPYAYAHNNPLNEYDPTGLCRSCDQCPGGLWRSHSAGVEGGAFLGLNTMHVRAWCESNPAMVIDNWITCLKIGFFAGGGLGGGPGQLGACSSAEAVGSLLGWGAFGGGSLGPFTVGGSVSLTDWEDFGVGVGGGAGLEAGFGVNHCWLVQ